MTKQERIECKTLVEDAKKQTAEDSTGNYIYRVRGAPGTMKTITVLQKLNNDTIIKTTNRNSNTGIQQIDQNTEDIVAQLDFAPKYICLFIERTINS